MDYKSQRPQEKDLGLAPIKLFSNTTKQCITAYNCVSICYYHVHSTNVSWDQMKECKDCERTSGLYGWKTLTVVSWSQIFKQNF